LQSYLNKLWLKDKGIKPNWTLINAEKA